MGYLRVEYRRVDVRQRVHVTVRGLFKLVDLAAILDRQASEAVWANSTLLDLQLGVLTSEDQAALAAYAEHLSRTHGPRGPEAIVTRNPANLQTYVLNSGIAGHTVQVFRFAFQAEQWLDEVDRSPLRSPRFP
jgi:hypothetical protein